MPKKTFLFTISSGQTQRLDVFLSMMLKELSRSQIQKLIDGKSVKIDGSERKSSYRLKNGERVEVAYEVPLPEKAVPKEMPIQCLYRDMDIAVIEKPSGLVVHPGAGTRGNTLVHALLFHFPEIREVGHEDRPGIVHRLDKETSGVMAVALSLRAYTELQRQFKKREVHKTYLGLVWGKMPQKSGKMDWAIGRHIRQRKRMSVKTRKPRPAETHYAVLQEYEDFTLLEIKAVTGRTHQIRVHLAASGHPVVGDSLYGRRRPPHSPARLFLHAHRLEFTHPVSGKKMAFTSKLPGDLRLFLKKLEARS